MKAIPDYPREMWVIDRARQFIKRAGICWLPVDPFAICKQFGWNVYTATQKAKEAGIPRSAMLNGEDSELWYWNGIYRIVYNERAFYKRIPYTIAHEIGHIVLNHVTDFEQTRMARGGLTDDEYKVLEREAEIFAAELLMPLPILRLLGTSSHQDIINVSKVSVTTARIRKDELRRSYGRDNTDDDIWMQEQFSLYLSKISVCIDEKNAPIQGVIIKHSEAICLREKHKYIPVDENNRFKICPQCGNTHFSEEANFCKLCGLYLYNDCSYDREYAQDYCGARNPGDARYCEKCGSPTMLMNLGLLMSWEEVVQADGEVAAALEPDEDEFNIPF